MKFDGCDYVIASSERGLLYVPCTRILKHEVLPTLFRLKQLIKRFEFFHLLAIIYGVDFLAG